MFEYQINIDNAQSTKPTDRFKAAIDSTKR